MRKPAFCICENKDADQLPVTAKLISAFVFATRIVHSLFFLNPKFQASSHLLWLYNPVCVGSGRKHRRQVFSQRGSSNNPPYPSDSVTELVMGGVKLTKHLVDLNHYPPAAEKEVLHILRNQSPHPSPLHQGNILITKTMKMRKKKKKVTLVLIGC